MKLWLLASIYLAIIKPSQHDKSESRLPRNVYPEHYRIRIITSLEEFEHNSDVNIIIRCLKATNKITLHSRDLLLSNFELTTIDNKRKIIIEPTFEVRYDFLHINAEEKLEVNKKYNLRIQFKGDIKTEPSGYFRSSYNENGKKKWIASTYFKPRYARTAFPCFDEPDLRSVFTIVLTQDGSLTALSNMPRKKQNCYSFHDSNWCENIHHDTPRMSTYSVAYVITSGFNSQTITEMNQDITIWGQQKIIQQMLGNIKNDFFQKYFAKASSLPKTDLVVVPNYPSPTGALENFGLVIVSEKFLFGNIRKRGKNGGKRGARQHGGGGGRKRGRKRGGGHNYGIEVWINNGSHKVFQNTSGSWSWPNDNWQDNPSWGDILRDLWQSLRDKWKSWGDIWRDLWQSLRDKWKSWGDKWRGKFLSDPWKDHDYEEDEYDEDDTDEEAIDVWINNGTHLLFKNASGSWLWRYTDEIDEENINVRVDNGTHILFTNASGSWLWRSTDEEEDKPDKKADKPDKKKDDSRRRRKDSDKRRRKGAGRRQKGPGGRSPAAKRAKKQGETK